MSLYHVAAYVRLSRDDGDKEESESIPTQIKIIMNYIDGKEDLIHYDTYVDDGFTGTNFNRPDFLRMINDIERGNVNCVIVKDLSRFGRDYIDTGQYLERLFPEWGVRFIAINDSIDTGSGHEYGILLPIKNIFNEQYARDISKKVHSSVTARQKAGDFIGSFASYGYTKSPADKNKLIIDEYAAGIVRKIYELYLSGMGQVKIAAYLNEKGVLCPSDYKNSQGLNYCNSKKPLRMKYWTYSTIHKILKNRIYAGDMVQGKTVTNMRKKAKAVDSDSWIIVENTHEPIIERGMWEKVQSELSIRTRQLDTTSKLSVFSGLLKCGDCGAAMVKVNRSTASGERRTNYACGSYKRTGNRYCSPHNIKHEVLEKIVLNDFRSILSHIDNIEKIIEQENKKQNSIEKSRKTSRDSITQLQNELDKIMKLKKGLYEDLKEGIITREEYTEYKESYTLKQANLQKRLQQAQENIRDSEKQKNIMDIPWIKKLSEFKTVDSLNRDICIEMISKIEIFQDKTIKITYRFSQELESLLSSYNKS